MATNTVLRTKWIAFGTVLLAFSSLVTFGMAFVPDNSAAFTTGALIVAAGLAVLALRAAFSRVVLTSTNLEIHGPLRFRQYDRTQVLEFEVDAVDEKLTAPVWAPIVHFRDGTTVELHLLAGYSLSSSRPNRRVLRQHEMLAAWLTGDLS